MRRMEGEEEEKEGRGGESEHRNGVTMPVC